MSGPLRANGGSIDRKVLLGFLSVPLILLGGIFVVKFVLWAFSSEKAQGKVSKLTWERPEDLRQREVRQNAGWGRTDQDGYYNEPTFDQHCERKAHGTYCCSRDHKSNCTGRCPDYDEWCRYKYYEWPIVFTKTVQGNELDSVTWPEIEEDSSHRAERHERYTVEFVNGPKKWVYWTRSFDRYQQFKLDDVWNLKLPHIGDMEPASKASLERE